MRLFGLTILLSAFLLFQVQLIIGRYVLPWFGGTPAVWTTCQVFFQLLLLLGYAYAHALQHLPMARAARTHGILTVGVVAIFLSNLLHWPSPITPGNEYRPAGDFEPVALLLQLLGAAVGLPFLMLSSTSPLLQAWFLRVFPGKSPYRLYALSNAGSLIGLLSYPFIIEPLLPVRWQAWIWSGLFLAYVGGLGLCMKMLRRTESRNARAAAPAQSPLTRPDHGQPEEELIHSNNLPTNPGGGSETTPGELDEGPTGKDYVGYLLLAAIPSAALLATTNQLCQETAVIPLLWVMPLAVYLISFILCFDREVWYQRRIFGALLLTLSPLSCWVLYRGVYVSLELQILTYVAQLFMVAMTCHGELARRRPPPAYLTSFFLTTSLGGAIGGTLVGILTPLVLPMFWEYHAMFWLSYVVATRALMSDRSSRLDHRRNGVGFSNWLNQIYLVIAMLIPLGLLANLVPPDAGVYLAAETFVVGLPVVTVAIMILGVKRSRRTRSAWFDPFLPKSRVAAVPLLSLGLILLLHASLSYDSTVAVMRNFYGVSAVREEHRDEPQQHANKLFHGRTSHGVQFQTPELRQEPTAYFSRVSGIGRAITITRAIKQRLETRQATLTAIAANSASISTELERYSIEAGSRSPIRLGCIGLGIGTIAAYGESGDIFRFYEINPQVISIATNEHYFTYINHSRAQISIALGDGRLLLEHELADGNPGRFDIFVIDAFSSDAIPVHLLTRESFGVYVAHLQPEHGLLAFHVSNRYLDLVPVIGRLSVDAGFRAVLVDTPPGDVLQGWGSTWVLVSRSLEVLEHALLQPSEELDKNAMAQKPIWTDDYSNLFSVLK